MNKDGHILTYILFVVAQMLLSNYFHFTPYVMLTILPVLVLFIHPKIGTVWAMFIAFGTGLAVDCFAEGLIGINAMSLVPVAFLRRPLIEAIFGNEPFELEESVSVRKYGVARVSLAVVVVLVSLVGQQFDPFGAVDHRRVQRSSPRSAALPSLQATSCQCSSSIS